MRIYSRCKHHLSSKKLQKNVSSTVTVVSIMKKLYNIRRLLANRSFLPTQLQRYQSFSLDCINLFSVPSFLQTFTALTNLIRTVIFKQRSTPEAIAAYFPSSFNADLKKALSALIASRFDEWFKSSLTSQLSLPRYKKLDWKFVLCLNIFHLFLSIHISLFPPSCIQHPS